MSKYRKMFGNVVESVLSEAESKRSYFNKFFEDKWHEHAKKKGYEVKKTDNGFTSHKNGEEVGEWKHGEGGWHRNKKD